MLRSKKVRSSRKLDEEWAAKEAEDEKSKKKVKKTRSSISLGGIKPIEELEEMKKGSAPSKLHQTKSSASSSSAASSSSTIDTTSKSKLRGSDDKKSLKTQKIKVQFELVFVSLRNLPAKMHSEGSHVLVRWKSSTKATTKKNKKTDNDDDDAPVRSKAETQAVEVKANGRAGWEGVGGAGAEGERFVFEEKLKYDPAAQTFKARPLELVLKEIKGKKKNHLHKVKVDVGEFARNGSTTRKDIALGKDDSNGPVLTVIFRARWKMIDNKVLVKKYGKSGENGKLEDDYDLLTVNEDDMSESEATDTDFSESESDMSESESDASDDSDSDSDAGGRGRSRPSPAKKASAGAKDKERDNNKTGKKLRKLEQRCRQLETVLLETKRELAEKKADNLQLQRQLREKDDQLASSSASVKAGSPQRTGSSGDLRQALDERDRRIERLEASLKGKDDEIKAVKSLFQTEIDELKKNKKRQQKADEDDDDDDDDDGDEVEEEWQMKIDRAAALYDFKARNEQEITLTKDEEFYVTDRDPFGVGTFASEWWRVVRRSKDARPADPADPGKSRQEGLAPITYFRITRPAQKEFSFKVSSKKSASIAELQRHCGFVGGDGSSSSKRDKKKKMDNKKSSSGSPAPASSSPPKKNESESENDTDEGGDAGQDKLKSLQKDRPMQQGKRLPSRFLSLRKKAKERMKLGDLAGGSGSGNGGGHHAEADHGGHGGHHDNNGKKGAKKAVGDDIRNSGGGVKTREVFLASDAETNRVLADLQREREWRDVIERAVYCADLTQFVPISAGPTFSSSSAATPTRASMLRRSDSDDDRNNDDDDSDDSTSSTRSGKHKPEDDDDDDEREERMLVGVHELVAYIKTRKVLEDAETSLTFVRPLCTALRATAQRAKSDLGLLASALAFTTALLHCLKAQKNYLHLPPFSEDRDKFFQALFVDPREHGIVTFTDEVMRRNELRRTAKRKLERLSESEERGLGGYKLLVRTLTVLVLDIYHDLLRRVDKEVAPLLIPALLEQPPDFFHLFASPNHAGSDRGGGRQFAYARPEDVVKQLTRVHSTMTAAGVWRALIQQFFVDVYQLVDVRLFNAVVERSDLCTPTNGFQIKTGLSNLAQWADGARFLDAIATKKQLAHVNEVASLLALDMSVLSDEADVREAFPTLTPKQLLHLASSFKPESGNGGVPRDALDMLKKMAARLPQQQQRDRRSSASSSSSAAAAAAGGVLKLSAHGPPLAPTKADYRQATVVRPESIVFRETL